MKIARNILCLWLVLGLILGLSACGSKEKADDGMAGTYELVQMESGGEILDREQLGGASFYLKLNGDGTGLLNILGQSNDMEYGDGMIWPAGSPEEKISLVVENDTATISNATQTMIFKK